MKRLIYFLPFLFISFTTLSGNSKPESDILKQFSIHEAAGKLLRTTTFKKDNQGWYHFYDSKTNNILLSIKNEQGGEIPANTEVSCGLLSHYGYEANEYHGSFQLENTAFFTMNRYWRITSPEKESKAKYLVRFYFSKQDLQDLKTSFQLFNFENPQIEKLTFYNYEGNNIHPFSKNLKEEDTSYNVYKNSKNRGIVISERFNYAEFKINELNSAGSGGFEKNLEELNFWFKGAVTTNFTEHLDLFKIKDINQDLNGHQALSHGGFSVPLQGGKRNTTFGFIFNPEDLPYLNINDLMRLKDHLTGDNPIEDPMLLHAADMDNNGIVDKYDYDFLFLLIKGEREGFSVKSAYSVMTKDDWEQLNNTKQFFTPKSTFSIDQVKKDVNQDFVFIVKGDLDQEKQSSSPSKANILSLSKVNSCGLGATTVLDLFGILEDDLNGLQFSIHWNPNELELIEIKDSIGKHKNLEYFNTKQISDGILGFACIDHKRLQVKNGKLLFGKLVFKVLDQAPNSRVSFSDYPSSIHVLDNKKENISIHLEDGQVLQDEERSITIEEMEIKQPTCNAPDKGSILVNAGQSIFSDMVVWNDGVTGLSRKNLSEGIYSFEINTKGKCAFKSDPIEFKVPSKPTVNLKNLKPLQCLDGSDASIEIEVEGGQAPYYFYWNNDERTAKIDHLSAGKYTVEVIDDNNCAVAANYEIESNGYLGLEYYVKPPSSNANADGIIEITNVQGVKLDKPEWIWQTGTKGQRLEGISPNYYTIEFKGPEGCKYKKTFNLKAGSPAFQTKAFFYESDVESGQDLARLNISSPITKNCTINLFNESSEVVWSKDIQVQSGINIFYIPVPKDQGNYLLQVSKVISQRFSIK